MCITVFISLYSTRIILNSLGVVDYGIFNIVGGAISMLGFLNGALADATQRFMSYSEGEQNKKKQKSIFNISIILHFIIACIASIALLICGSLFFNGILNIPTERLFAAKIIYGSLITSTAFTIMSVPYDAAINAHENMKYYAIVGIVESLLKLSVAFITAKSSSDKLIVYGILMACIPFITLTILRIYCKKNYEECTFNPKKYFSKPLASSIINYAAYNFVGIGGNMIGNYGNGIIVNHFFGVTLNAAMGIVTQITGQLMAFSNNLMKAINPVIVKKEGANDSNAMLYYSFIGCKFPVLMFSIFAIPFWVETHYILQIWLGNIPQWTLLFVKLQIIRIILELLTLGLNTTLAAKGKIKRWNIANVVISLTSLILLYILYKFNLPEYTLFIVTITSYGIVLGIIRLHYCKTYCRLRYKSFLKEVLLPCLLTLSICFILSNSITFFLEESIIRLCLVFIVCLLSHLGTIYYTILKPEERKQIKSFIKRI